MSNTVIKIENLYKEYRLGVIGHGTLYRDLQSWWAKARGKPDPNSLLGAASTNQSKDRILALKDINLEVKDGEVLGIIGANGAGKSTLLKILSKVTAPTRGTIKYKGRVASLLEVGTGFHNELTGRENIFLNGAINGMEKKEVKSKLDEIVDFAGVEHFLDTPVKRYSSGMHVRLGFAVAAHMDPDILVVDEVLAVGDASFQKKAINKMQDASKEEGRTVLFVSHNMQSVRQLCSRGVLIKKGGIVKDGPINEVVKYYLEESEAENTDTQIFFDEDFDKEYQILSFGILDNSGIKSINLDRTKGYKIFIDYCIRKPTDQIYVQLEISNLIQQWGISPNTPLLDWSDKHYKRYKFGHEKIDKTEGYYRAYINLPGYLLNSGKYKLNVGLVYGDVWYENNREGVVFDLYDIGSSHSFKAGQRGGLLAIPLDWEEERFSKNMLKSEEIESK